MKTNGLALICLLVFPLSTMASDSENLRCSIDEVMYASAHTKLAIAETMLINDKEFIDIEQIDAAERAFQANLNSTNEASIEVNG